MVGPELLLILDVERVGERLSRFRVSQKVSPRVVIVAGSAHEELASVDGVLAVVAPGASLADELRASLTPTEALFVDAFRQRAEPKQRPGDGLPWDAEGFLPPDPPRKR
jgi:hypothetical protein